MNTAIYPGGHKVSKTVLGSSAGLDCDMGFAECDLHDWCGGSKLTRLALGAFKSDGSYHFPKRSIVVEGVTFSVTKGATVGQHGVWQQLSGDAGAYPKLLT